jgi:ATP-dependent protease HslVU (ClpYQ) peptidase subunit
MSLIVARIDRKNHRLYFGADRCLSGGERRMTLKTPKYKCYEVPNSKSELLIGFVGEGKQFQDLLETFEPDEHSSFLSVELYISLICKQLKAIIQELDFLASDENGITGFMGQAIVGYCGRIFTITSRFMYVESDLMFDAVGSGQETALGVLSFTDGWLETDADGEVESALLVAEQFNVSVKAPFDISYIEIQEEFRWYVEDEEDTEEVEFSVT